MTAPVRVDDRNGVRVRVRVNTDHDVDIVCQDGHAFTPSPEDRWLGSAPGGDGRTVTGHTESTRWSSS